MLKVTMTEVLPPCACLPLQATRAKRLPIAQPHPTLGALGGHRLYGIRTFAVHAPAMVTVAEPCADAARTKDARDKYFAVSVRESSSDAGKRLEGELPAFEARACSAGAVPPRGWRLRRRVPA